MENAHALKAKIIALLNQDPSISLAILFGSFANGRATATSDVDIAVAGHDLLSADQRLRLVGLIAKTVGREVDLIDLQAVTGTVRHQAMTKGIVLVNKDPDLYAKIIRDMLYYEADFAPQIQQLIDDRLKKFIDG